MKEPTELNCFELLTGIKQGAIKELKPKAVNIRQYWSSLDKISDFSQMRRDIVRTSDKLSSKQIAEVKSTWGAWTSYFNIHDIHSTSNIRADANIVYLRAVFRDGIASDGDVLVTSLGKTHYLILPMSWPETLSDEQKHILVHEIGHILGLKHIVQYANNDLPPFLMPSNVDSGISVMTYNGPWTKRPGWCDIEALSRLVSLKSYDPTDEYFIFTSQQPYPLIHDTGQANSLISACHQGMAFINAEPYQHPLDASRGCGYSFTITSTTKITTIVTGDADNIIAPSRHTTKIELGAAKNLILVKPNATVTINGFDQNDGISIYRHKQAAGLIDLNFYAADNKACFKLNNTMTDVCVENMTVSELKNQITDDYSFPKSSVSTAFFSGIITGLVLQLLNKLVSKLTNACIANQSYRAYIVLAVTTCFQAYFFGSPPALVGLFSNMFFEKLAPDHKNLVQISAITAVGLFSGDLNPTIAAAGNFVGATSIVAVDYGLRKLFC